VIRNVVVENEYNFENSMVLFILAGHEIGVLQRFFDPESVKAAVDQMQEIYNGKRTLFCGGRKVVAWTAKATSWWIRHRQEIPAELRPRVDNFLDQETDNTGIPEEIRARFRDNIPEEYWGDRFWRRHADLRCHLTDRPIRRIARIVGEEGRYYEYETLKTFLLEHNRPESDIDVISDDVIRRQGYITHKVFEYMDRVMDTHIFNSAYED
jgi:hypothetical protein